MELYLGYDPGGKCKNGVAAIQLCSDAPKVVETKKVRDAVEAIAWLTRFSCSAHALGIDTLLAWSPKGGRACDDALRRRYGGNSIVAQNSLYSAMTLNGAIVARRLGLPVYESHPKLILQTNLGNSIRQIFEKTMPSDATEHEVDAIVAAWCAAMGHTQKWTTELYSDIEDDIELVVPDARYPWFESIEGS